MVSLRLQDNELPAEEAIGVIPLRGLGEVQAITPATVSRVLDRFETQIGEPQFATAGEPDLKFSSLVRTFLGLDSERDCFPCFLGCEVLIIEETFPVGCILHCPTDFFSSETLGSGSQ